MGHFTGQRAWMPIEDIVNKQSGVLVGEYYSKFNIPTRAPHGVHVPLIMYLSIQPINDIMSKFRVSWFHLIVTCSL